MTRLVIHLIVFGLCALLQGYELYVQARLCVNGHATRRRLRVVAKRAVVFVIAAGAAAVSLIDIIEKS